MKNSLKFYYACLIVIFAFTLEGCAPNDKKVDTEDQTQDTMSKDTVIIPKTRTLLRTTKNTHTVVLIVDTENITKNSKPKDYCTFPELGMNPPKDSIENYTTDVLAGDEIEWMGISYSAPTEDHILIDRIIRRGGPPLLIDTISIKGKVKGRIRIDSLDKPGQEEIYDIHFRTIIDGDTSRNYVLHPKIRVH
jgi:hypothetical protein